MPTPVLEITLLSIKPPYTASSPSVLTTLQQTRTAIAQKVYPTNSRFYTPHPSPNEKQNKNEILILGIWPSVEKHTAFLADEKLRNEILGDQEGMFEFLWGIYVQIEGGDGARVKRLMWSEVQWLSLGRWRCCEGIEEFKWEVEGGGKELEIVKGWKCDDSEEKKDEYVRIVGWRGDIGSEMEVQDAMVRVTGKEGWEVVEARTMRDMEVRGGKEKHESMRGGER